MTRSEGEPLHNNPVLHAFETTRRNYPQVKGLEDFVGLDQSAREDFLTRAIINVGIYFMSHSHPRFQAIGSTVISALAFHRIKLGFPDIEEKDTGSIRKRAATSVMGESEDGELPLFNIPLGFGVKAIEDPIEALGLALYSFCEVEVFMNEWSESDRSNINQEMIAESARATQAEFYLMARREVPTFTSRTADNVLLSYQKGLRSFPLEPRLVEVPLEILDKRLPRTQLTQ